MQGIFNYTLKGSQEELEEIYSLLKNIASGVNSKLFSQHEAECLLYDSKGVEGNKYGYSLTLGLEGSGSINHVEFQFNEMAEYLAQLYPQLELEGFGGFLDIGTSDYYSPVGSSYVEFIDPIENIEIYLEDEEEDFINFECSLCNSENEIDISNVDYSQDIEYECTTCCKQYVIKVILEEDFE